MAGVLFVLGVVITWLGSTMAGYIVGRILLPAMGLTAPGFWVWFWAVFWLLVFATAIKLLLEWMGD